MKHLARKTDRYMNKTHVQIGAHEDNLALEVSLAEIANRLLGHGCDHTGALALQMRTIDTITYPIETKCRQNVPRRL